MDSLFEYVIILSIIWSFISSYLSKKKKAQKANEISISENEPEFNTQLIDEISTLLKPKEADLTIDSSPLQMKANFPKKEKREFVKREFKSDIKKRTSKNKRLNTISIDTMEDSFLHHVQHIPDDIQVHTELLMPHPVIGNLNAERIREAFILKEIIDKPVALRTR